jgi:hypothetical protein
MALKATRQVRLRQQQLVAPPRTAGVSSTLWTKFCAWCVTPQWLSSYELTILGRYRDAQGSRVISPAASVHDATFKTSATCYTFCVTFSYPPTATSSQVPAPTGPMATTPLGWASGLVALGPPRPHSAPLPPPLPSPARDPPPPPFPSAPPLPSAPARVCLFWLA